MTGIFEKNEFNNGKREKHICQSSEGNQGLATLLPSDRPCHLAASTFSGASFPRISPIPTVTTWKMKSNSSNIRGIWRGKKTEPTLLAKRKKAESRVRFRRCELLFCSFSRHGFHASAKRRRRKIRRGHVSKVWVRSKREGEASRVE